MNYLCVLVDIYVHIIFVILKQINVASSRPRSLLSSPARRWREAEEMMNLLITQSLIEGVAALSVLIRTHREGDTIHLWSVLW